MMNLPEPDLHDGVVIDKEFKYAGTQDGYTEDTVKALLQPWYTLKQKLSKDILARGEWGMREDDYFDALEYVLSEMDKIVGCGSDPSWDSRAKELLTIFNGKDCQ
jgi:hypothetical protein